MQQIFQLVNDPGDRPTTLLLALGLLSMFFYWGCGAEKEIVKEEPTIEEIIASIPPIELSEENLVYSRAGDLRAALPKKWIALDALGFNIPELFVVACDADYSMTLLFSEIPLGKELGSAYQAGGMAGLAREHFRDRSERSGGMELQLIESGEFTIGRRRFYAYLYTNDGMVTCTRVALFYTDKNLYECTITHLPYSESELPSRERMQEIHQIILGGITW